eukprot:TRINITY_DN22390_c0_g1_i1.p1 TRINITY_DN22390_c0_g1~~TRINITY_DN22390_c0_g1_i1.p1  ORF type:complete len:562 (+),score=197.14 TRINITY_DN22390_c0_g1_i1:98-1687(+)
MAVAKAPGASDDGPSSDLAICSGEPFQRGRLSVTVLGASGDLAKKKTYPALFDLFANGFLPKHVVVMGYARSAKSDEDFRASIRPFLVKGQDEKVVDTFLNNHCFYFQGGYDSVADFGKLSARLAELEGAEKTVCEPDTTNRLFYFAIPPNVFLASAKSIKEAALTTSGFNRLIVEKPFGHDLQSARQLASDLGEVFSEDHIYRIDHYLGKEMVQNLLMFRFGNTFLEPLFNNRYIQSVRVTFKENFGTEGRGGYFTNYGIIRDVMQNHLMQVLSLVGMEAPPRIHGADAGNMVRNAKVQLLQSLRQIDPAEVVVGQYVKGDGEDKPGFLEDPSIAPELQEKAKHCPTFAMCVLRIDNPRWEGVPFIMKAGKALDERKAEIRIQFKDTPASAFMFGHDCPRNELVLRLQPQEAVYMKVNVKQPGLSFESLQSELDLTYHQRYKGTYNPDAYTRLVLEALRGRSSMFVRSDELEEAWKVFDPLLKTIGDRVPLPYKYGSRGPEEADKVMQAVGFTRNEGYTWRAPSLHKM